MCGGDEGKHSYNISALGKIFFENVLPNNVGNKIE